MDTRPDRRTNRIRQATDTGRAQQLAGGKPPPKGGRANPGANRLRNFLRLAFGDDRVRRFMAAAEGGVRDAPSIVYDILSAASFGLICLQTDWEKAMAKTARVAEDLAQKMAAKATPKDELAALRAHFEILDARATNLGLILAERRRTMGALKRSAEAILQAHKLDFIEGLGDTDKKFDFALPLDEDGGWLPVVLQGGAAQSPE